MHRSAVKNSFDPADIVQYNYKLYFGVPNEAKYDDNINGFQTGPISG